MSKLTLGEVVEALNDDKHVVDAQAEEEEGERRVHGTLEQPESQRQTVAGQHAQPDIKGRH